MTPLTSCVRGAFDRVVDVVSGVILAFIMLGIAVGTLRLFVTTWQLLAFEGITGNCMDLITDALTLYVLIELSRSPPSCSCRARCAKGR